MVCSAQVAGFGRSFGCCGFLEQEVAGFQGCEGNMEQGDGHSQLVPKVLNHPMGAWRNW
jgi:hypothetical protein